MKINRIFMMSMMGGAWIVGSSSLMAGKNDQEQQDIVVKSPNQRMRFGRFFRRSSSNNSSTSSMSQQSDSMGSMQNNESISSSSSSGSENVRKKNRLAHLLSRRSSSRSSSSSSIQHSSLQEPAAETQAYDDIIEKAELALLGLTKAAPEIFTEDDNEVKELSEIDGFITRLENIQDQLNLYRMRADPNFAVSYVRTLYANFDKENNFNPRKIYTHLGCKDIEEGIVLSCSKCKLFIQNRKRDHPEEENLLRQIEYMFRNNIAKQHLDACLKGGALELTTLKITPKDGKHYEYLATFATEIKEELREFKKNNSQICARSPVTNLSGHDLADHAFSLELDVKTNV